MSVGRAAKITSQAFIRAVSSAIIKKEIRHTVYECRSA
jgi:hypothetical protein